MLQTLKELAPNIARVAMFYQPGQCERDLLRAFVRGRRLFAWRRGDPFPDPWACRYRARRRRRGGAAQWRHLCCPGRHDRPRSWSRSSRLSRGIGCPLFIRSAAPSRTGAWHSTAWIASSFIAVPAPTSIGSARREARRSAVSAADQVRAGDQPQDRRRRSAFKSRRDFCCRADEVIE